MFRMIQRLVCHAYGDTIPTVEEWAMRHKDRCSADQIIAAHCINSIAKDVNDWKLIRPGDDWDEWYDLFQRYKFEHGVDSLLINRQRHKNVKSVHIFYNRQFGKNPNRFFYINGVKFNDYDGREIIDSYLKVKAQKEEVERVAARALREQQLLEQKWNMAEELLGMKRNEFGALEPIGD